MDLQDTNQDVNVKEEILKEDIQKDEILKEEPQKQTGVSPLEIDDSILENIGELERIMEAIIYVEGNVSINRLKNLFRCESDEIREHIQNINNKYKNAESAIEILEVGESVMMTVIPSVFGVLSVVYDKKRKKKISKAMLQTLSIIAYKQPLTKAEIDDIRQSDSSYHLRSLMEDGFIEWKGRKDYLDKRQTYGTTDKFLMHFGISSISELPKLRELKDLEFDKNG